MVDSKYGCLVGGAAGVSSPTRRRGRATPRVTDVALLASSNCSAPSPSVAANNSLSHVDSRVEYCVREVRSIADAQARLLRVVEGISRELSRVGSSCLCKQKQTGSSADEVRVEFLAHISHVMSTVEGLQRAVRADCVESVGGMVTPRLARHDAEIAQILRSRAEESARTDRALSEFKMLVGGICGQLGRLNAEMAQLWRLHGEATASNGATVAEMQRQQHAEIERLQAASGNASAWSTQHEAEIAELRRLCDEAATRHTELASELKGDKQTSSQACCHDTKIAELEKLQASHSLAQESKIAELKQLVASQASTQESRVMALQRLQEAAFAEWNTLPNPSERSKMQEILGRRVESLRSQVRSEVASLQRQIDSDLRIEMRNVTQSHAVAIKALDEQLWLVDEQLWQAEQRLNGRIDEVVANRSSPPPNVSAANAATSDAACSEGVDSPNFSFSNGARGETEEVQEERNANDNWMQQIRLRAESDGARNAAFADMVNQTHSSAASGRDNSSLRTRFDERRRRSGSVVPSFFATAADELAEAVNHAKSQQARASDRDKMEVETSTATVSAEAPGLLFGLPTVREEAFPSHNEAGRVGRTCLLGSSGTSASVGASGSCSVDHASLMCGAGGNVDASDDSIGHDDARGGDINNGLDFGSGSGAKESSTHLPSAIGETDMLDMAAVAAAAALSAPVSALLSTSPLTDVS